MASDREMTELMTENNWGGLGMALFGVMLTVAFAFLSGAVSADTVKKVPGSHLEVQLSYAPVVQKTAPAVVNVYSKRTVKEARSPFSNDPFFKRFFGDRFSFGMPRERVQQSLGSGVIVGSNGIIVTNNHVIAEGDEFTVALADRREFQAEVVLADEQTDLAVLRIDPKGETLPALTFKDSDTVEVGDLVLAVGNPFGVGQTVTSGIVSALARTQVGVSDYQFFIQTDAAINPGNSGGALVTLDGKLIGINTAIFSRSGGSVGIGFAIPANMVRAVVDSAVDGGQVERPWLGASLQVVTSELAETLGLDRPGGALVQNIYPGSPADQGGLNTGDVIRAVDGREVVDPQSVQYRMATRGLGGSIAIEFSRDGSIKKTKVALLSAPENPPRDLRELKGEHPFNGSTVGNLSPAFAEELRIDAFSQGVVVVRILRGSSAHRVGLRPRDVILEISGEKVKSVSQLEAMVGENRRVWELKIKRGNEVITASVRG
ncbi:MAG: serine protease Do [Parvibaculaceae bacterium]|jgi:Do/DeqQ family serine protease|nr:DegQ family serine endoprotease [Parvibaculaceae bacterium]